jgi:trimethylamine:corrinoid methyltransferase-like protein
VWQQLLAAYSPPPIDPGLADGLNDFVQRRRREIGE